MKASHTPGPWFVASNGLNKVATITNTTAVYADQMPTEFSISADARVISAAPELLQALRELGAAFMSHTQWNGEPPSEILKARAAINKALGVDA